MTPEIRQLSARIEALRGEMLKLEARRAILERELAGRSYVKADPPLLYPNGFEVARQAPRARAPQPKAKTPRAPRAPRVLSPIEAALSGEALSL